MDLSGEDPAKASLLKVIGNVLIMTTMETVAEAHVFSEKTGLGTNHMRTLISTLFPRPPHTIYSEKMVSGDYYQKKVSELGFATAWLPANVAFNSQW